MMIGDNIKRKRKFLNLTQKQLAEKTGLTGQIISNIEREYTNPSHEDVIRIAKALDTTPNELFGIKEVNKESSIETLAFNRLDGFDDLDSEDQQRIIQHLEEQAEFLIAKAKKNK